MQRLSLFLVCSALTAGAAYAQVPATDGKLAEARARLEAAAREVAELSGTAGQFGPQFIWAQGPGRRAMLGINIGGSDGDGPSEGVRISGISPDGPADVAGLNTGDVLVKIKDTALAGSSTQDSAQKLLNAMAAIEPGEKVSVEYLRDGKRASAMLTAQHMPQPYAFAFGDGAGNWGFRSAEGPGERRFGPPMFNFQLGGPWADLELVALTPGLGAYFGTDEGVLVVRAPRDANLKLEDGDVLLAIGGRRPNSPEHAFRILGSYAPGESMEVQVMRKQRRQDLKVTVPQRGPDVGIIPGAAPPARGMLVAPPTPPAI